MKSDHENVKDFYGNGIRVVFYKALHKYCLNYNDSYFRTFTEKFCFMQGDYDFVLESITQIKM